MRGFSGLDLSADGHMCVVDGSIVQTGGTMRSIDTWNDKRSGGMNNSDRHWENRLLISSKSPFCFVPRRKLHNKLVYDRWNKLICDGRLVVGFVVKTASSLPRTKLIRSAEAPEVRTSAVSNVDIESDESSSIELMMGRRRRSITAVVGPV